MKKTDSKRKRQAQETRERILSAAIALVEEKGIDGFTIDDIQERTGCSRGLFYNYFQSLNDIVSEIVGVTENQYKSIRDELLADTRGMEKILLFLQYVAMIHDYHDQQEEKSLLRIHYINLLKSADKSTYVLSDDRLLYVILQQALQECQADGQLVAGTDIKQTADDIAVILRGCILDYLFSRDKEYDIIERVGRLAAAYLSGIHVDGICLCVPSIEPADSLSLISTEYYTRLRKSQTPQEAPPDTPIA